jgi:hypothetical protein
MELSLILLTGVGVWSFVLLMAISLCKAAKHGDDIVEADYAAAENAARLDADSPPRPGRIAHEVIGLAASSDS